MPRYKATLAYDGARFSGWQIQPGCRSVQGEVSRALTLLNGEPVSVTGAGRTDAGVHAWGQTASFWMDKPWKPSKLRLALNANLPEGVAASRICLCDDHFDARRNAQWRLYRYHIWSASWCPPQLKPWVWWRKGPKWNMDLLAKGSQVLQGYHDFSAFCRLTEVPDNPWRRIYSLQIAQRGFLTVLSICGDAFLTNMVRIMVGNLDEVARRRQTVSWLKGLLDGKSRCDSAMTAPASGLFFWRVGYRSRKR